MAALVIAGCVHGCVFVERECLTKVLGPVTKAVALVWDLNDEDM